MTHCSLFLKLECCQVEGGDILYFYTKDGISQRHSFFTIFYLIHSVNSITDWDIRELFSSKSKTKTILGVPNICPGPKTNTDTSRRPVMYVYHSSLYTRLVSSVKDLRSTVGWSLV